MEKTSALSPLVQLNSLTGLRGIAAFLVFLFHFTAIHETIFKPETKDFLFWLVSRASFVSVSFFFLLSGFILTWVHINRLSMLQFWRGRIFKIFPNHIVTFAMILPVLYWIGTPPRTISEILPNLFLIQTWLPLPDVIMSMNFPSWSLCCELFFYLTFPFILPLTRKIPAHDLWTLTNFSLFLIISLPFLTNFLPEKPVLHDYPLFQYWFIYFFPPIRLLEFIVGMLMARIIQENRWINLPVWPAIGLIIYSYWTALHMPHQYGRVAITIIPFALLIPTFAIVDLHQTRSILRYRFFVWLGNISFALYLVHLPVILAFNHLLRHYKTWNNGEFLAWLLIEFLICIGLATLLYYGVEKPCMRIAKQKNLSLRES